MGNDEGRLVRLWQREARRGGAGGILSGDLIVQLGTITEDLNRSWYERGSGNAVEQVQRRVLHPVTNGWAPRWMGEFSRPGAGIRSQIHAALEFLGRSKSCRRKAYGPTSAQHVGGGSLRQNGRAVDHHRWWNSVELTIPADPLYQHLLLDR